jgi:hypothetical protein
VLPVIEVAETRLADWLDASPAALLADLLCHGGLVLGESVPFEKAWLDLAQTEVVLHFDEQVVAHTVGEHPHPDVGALLVWLVHTPWGGSGAWVSTASREGPPAFQYRGGASNQPSACATRCCTA